MVVVGKTVRDSGMNKPKMVNLPILRDTYCSQVQTDKICNHLWSLAGMDSDGNPTLVQELVYAVEAHSPGGGDHAFHVGFDDIYMYLCGHGDDSLPEIPKDIEVPDTVLAYMDVMFEFLRRVSFIVFGKPCELLGERPLCDDIEGPYPELSGVPDLDESYWVYITPSLSAKVAKEFYQTHPKTCYEYVECIRTDYVLRGVAETVRLKILAVVKQREDILSLFKTNGAIQTLINDSNNQEAAREQVFKRIAERCFRVLAYQIKQYIGDHNSI